MHTPLQISMMIMYGGSLFLNGKKSYSNLGTRTIQYMFMPSRVVGLFLDWEINTHRGLSMVHSSADSGRSHVDGPLIYTNWINLTASINLREIYPRIALLLRGFLIHGFAKSNDGLQQQIIVYVMDFLTLYGRRTLLMV